MSYLNLHTSLDIVIPTLGRESLYLTLQALLLSRVYILRIYVCIPYFSDVPQIPEDSVITVLRCPKAGQVSQRHHGFMSTTAPFVMQLDDDILIDPTSLENLLFYISSVPQTAVAPRLIEYDSAFCLRSLRCVSPNKLCAPPLISPFGPIKTPTSVLQSYIYALTNCDWLPGGCIIHHSCSLPLTFYYPFPGKAYFEDVLMSYNFRCKNITLTCLSYAIALTPIDQSRPNIKQIFSIVHRHYYLFSHLKMSTILTLPYLFLFIIRGIFR